MEEDTVERRAIIVDEYELQVLTEVLTKYMNEHQLMGKPHASEEVKSFMGIKLDWDELPTVYHDILFSEQRADRLPGSHIRAKRKEENKEW